MAMLTGQECERLGTLAASLDCSRIRIYRTTARGAKGLLRRAILRLSGGRAIALGNHIFLPDRHHDDLAVLAHELTHCLQYQSWGPLHYFSRGAVVQLRDLLYRTVGIGSSAYRYQAVPGRPFQAYGMEQQGQIVEDCFRGQPLARTISPFQPGEADPTHVIPSA
jgi:Domain of unknown function (DUF4157)